MLYYSKIDRNHFNLKEDAINCEITLQNYFFKDDLEQNKKKPVRVISEL